MADFIDLSSDKFFEFYKLDHIVAFYGNKDERCSLRTVDNKTYYISPEDSEWLVQILRIRAFKKKD